MSPQQQQVLDTLERLSLHFVHAGPLESSTLGRSEEKFRNLLLHLANGLPQSDASSPVEVDGMLSQLVSALHADWEPYNGGSSFRRASSSGSHDNRVEVPLESAGSRVSALECKVDSGLSCKPVVASRVKWSLPPSFDPVPYLTDPLVKASYLDPDVLRAPSHEWPVLPPAHVHATKQQILELATKWDEHHALKIVCCSEVCAEEAVGCFCVPKDSEWDRFILNPVVVNSRTKAFSHYTKFLAPGSLLTLAHLPSDDSVLRMSAEDLSEMYYTFKVSASRARRNAIRVRFQAHELSHFKAFDPQVHVGDCYVCLNALAMGDNMAVEFAQQAHYNVLRTLANCMRPNELVAYRLPFPRGRTMEFLSIDDHLVAQVVSRAAYLSSAPDRDTEIFFAAEAAYPAVGLVQHPRKRQRQVSAGIFLGADVDGLKGLVGPPGHRLGVLMMVTAVIVRKGFASPSLLASVLGLWVSALMFRRPALAVLSKVFQDARREPRHRLFALQRDSINELQSLCILAPLLSTDLRVDYCPQLFAMDASPDGSGLVAAPLEAHVVQELWRFSEQKGFYTRLLEPSACLLQELGIDPEPFFGASSMPSVSQDFPVPGHLHEGFVFECLEVFSGSGNWSRAHREAGFSVHPGVDISGNQFRFQDMAVPATFHELCALVLRRAVREWHFGPPCVTYGTLRRPRIRSKRSPAGFNLKDPLTRLHNSFAIRTCFLCCLICFYGGFFSVEQPGAVVCFTCSASRAWPHWAPF